MAINGCQNLNEANMLNYEVLFLFPSREKVIMLLLKVCDEIFEYRSIVQNDLEYLIESFINFGVGT